MAVIKAFSAVRPTRDKVHLVATRPFYTYKKNVLKAKLEDNPYTFLHIINPEFGQEKKTKPNSIERFQHVLEKYNAFRDEKILLKDTNEHIYLYRQTKPEACFVGWIGGASIEEYLNGRIKIHESTLTTREKMFTKYLEVVGFNAEPVLLTYKGNQGLNALMVDQMSSRPEFEFTTTDKVKHELWILDDENSLKVRKGFSEVECLYIADGHHRSASSVRYAQSKMNSELPFCENDKFFLSYFVEEGTVDISAFNRLVKHLNGYSMEEFIAKLETLGEVKELPNFRKPECIHEFVLCAATGFYSLKINQSLINYANPVDHIDAEILTKLILEPLLGIKDLRMSKDIEFIPDIGDENKIIAKINAGKAAIAFFLFPCTMDQIKAVADASLFMPPKSTWVEPKLRSGLTIYPLNDD